MADPAAGAIQAAIEDLTRQVRGLQARVLHLEQRLGEVSAPPALELEEPASAPGEESTIPDVSGALPVVGRALLGIAGAYLLRALTELGVLPHSLGVALGAFYAAGWLVLAARAPAERILVVTVHCLTSVLVLAPLLWEATFRFQVLPSWVTAAILVLFSAFGLAISWRKNLTVIVWVTTLAGMGTAAALLVATRDVLPFTIALLAIAAAIEFSACCDHWMGERWIAAVLADLTVVLLTYLMARHGGFPEGYVPVPLAAVVVVQILLLTLYLASTVVRTLLRGLSFTTFETLQAVAAFLLCIGGSLRLAQGDQTAFWVTGAFALLSGATCYVVAFAFLDQKERRERNFYTYSTFALLLVVAGSAILLSGVALAALWSVLGLVYLWLGGHFGRSTVRLHGAAYLVLAGCVSGIVTGAASSLMSAGAQWDAPTLAGWLTAGAVLLSYPLAVWTARPDKTHWVERLSLLVVAGSVAWTTILLLTGLAHFAWHAFGGAGKAGMTAASETGMLTLFAVALAWFGKRCGRWEISRLVYPLMILIGYRILMRDFNLGHTLALFLSLLLYGGALVLLPRISARSSPDRRG
jgi:hypothetical protein